MELFLIVGIALIMALIRLISMMLQVHLKVNNDECQREKQRIPARESLQLIVSLIENTERSYYKK